MSTTVKLSLLFVIVFVICGILFNLLFGDPYTLKSLAKDTLSGITVALLVAYINKNRRKSTGTDN